MADELVPEVSSLDDIYSSVDQRERYAAIFDSFASKYNAEPEFLSRSPGRVNLIGEHIDYCYFSVLPMAIESDIVIAVRKNNDACLRLANTDARFPPTTVPLSASGAFVVVDKADSSWADYFKCGHLVAHEFLNSAAGPAAPVVPLGMDIVVDGTVPAASGLSSSAAFICAAALATLRVNGVTSVSKQELTAMAIVSERHLGVFSGGMDQSASVYGKPDHALYVQFKPELRCTPFKFPAAQPPLSFVIANSLVHANKHDTAPTNYNLRVVEVSLAAEILAHKYAVVIPQDSGIGTGTLRGFMEAYFAKKEGALPWDGDVDEGSRRLTEMAELVRQTFTIKDGYTKEQAAAALGVSDADLHQKFLAKTPVRFSKLQLYGRALHVYEEAGRVLKYLTTMLHPPSSPSSSDSIFTSLGSLMDQSHASLDTLFDSSCPELNTLCSIARANGSAGSRVTGAGWGGCTVHLVPLDKAEKLNAALREQYYKVRFPGISDEDIEQALVVSKPGIGSLVYTGGRPQI
ncbi:ribosomal protein S5 domain 2-type protein [Myxozyma melibiosi]|uniref:Galactokinase n=1 Tax=Myxozyma melibiosi TaxID=54550 RepID=A0ABR1FF26_9ASCO